MPASGVQCVGGFLLEVVLDSLDPLGRLIASAPTAATLANGARLAWPAGQGLYAETFGKLRFETPNPPPRAGDCFAN